MLIAGPLDSHPKDTHEYERSVILLKHCLETSSNLPSLAVEVHFNGWPADPATLDNASTIVLISGGSDRQETDHPLYVGDRKESLARQMERGCGVALIHWSTFNPSRFHDQITEWVGGYFDYEKGPPPRNWFSTIETRQWTAVPADPAHPICRGVEPFQLNEEFYFKLRFRDGDQRLKPVLFNQARGDQALDTVGWCVERADGGRGFGFTGGHFYRNWWIPEFRKFVLNAIVWTAGVEVPQGGVESKLEDPIRTLIVTGHNHPAHDWAKVTDALVRVLEHDPRTVISVTTDPERTLAEADLSQFDVLVLNYCNWERPGLGEQARRRLLERLKSDCGVSVVHFANGAFNKTLPNTKAENDWEEYRTRIVRRAWMHGDQGSGHDAFGEFRVDIARPDHPITAGLDGFTTIDELYFNQQGPLEIEPLATARSRVTGKDEPMAWVYEYEKSRVFQTVLGHAAESVVAAGALIRRGTVWTANVSPLSFDPSLEIVGRAPTWRDQQQPAKAPGAAQKKPVPRPKIEGHWGEDAVGVRWTEDDSRDNRLANMDTGRFYSGTILVGDGITNKALAVRVGDRQQASICYDTDLLRATGAWTGKFLRHDPARYGLIVPPVADGPIAMLSRPRPGWAGPQGHWSDPRPRPYGPLDRSWARIQGMYRHGSRVVLSMKVGGVGVMESPWIEETEGVLAFRRSLQAEAGDQPIACYVCDLPANGELRRDSLGRGRRLMSSTASGKTVAVGLITKDVHGDLQPLDGGVVCTAGARRQIWRAKLLIWSGPSESLSRFRDLVASSPEPEDLTPLTEPDEPQWKFEPVTAGVRGAGPGAYVVDTIGVPFDNPYKALMFLSGHDFLSSGEAAVCTAHGDVWLVSGIDASLRKVTWKRYATGLFQPLGLKVVRDQIYVLGRDQITVLHDRNGDREADFYETFNNDGQVSDNGHEYATCLEMDGAGNFYYLRGDSGSRTDHDGCLLRVSADGQKLEVFATGFRNANGMGIGPGDLITVSPQEGEWTPGSAIFPVRQGGFYGGMQTHHRPTPPSDYDRPMCWIPRRMDNSSGGQVWAPAGARGESPWGPMSGGLLHLAYGRCKLMLVLRQPLDGAPAPHLPEEQAAVVELPLDFESGVMRGRFSPHDGQLYVTGLRGWVTNAVHDGCLARVRYTGAAVSMPIGWRVLANGVRIDFSGPLDRETAEDPGNYSVEGWNYLWSSAYGSDEYLVRDPAQRGRDEFDVQSATLLEGDRSVFLEIPNLAPMMQMQIRMELASQEHRAENYTLAGTIHKVGIDRIEPKRPTRPRPGVLSEEQRGMLRPGWRFEFDQTISGADYSDVTTSPLAALMVEDGQPPSALLAPGPFRMKAVGYIKTSIKGDFSLKLSGLGWARLAVNGTLLADEADLGAAVSHPLRLHKGYNLVELDYDSRQSSQGWWRLEWSGQGFGFEPLPAGALSHLGGDEALSRGELLRNGRNSYLEFGCARCHANSGGPASDLFAAPSLALTSSRLRPQWVAEWLLDPHKLRAGAVMPQLLSQNQDLARQQAADIACWLASLPQEEVMAPEPDRELSAKGEALYEDLGCIACHRWTATTVHDPYDRISLTHIGAKFSPAGLADYLSRPHLHRPASPMPDFRLDGEEVAAMAAYLLDRAPSDEAPMPESAKADAQRGRQLFEQLGCRQCHAAQVPVADAPISGPLAGADLSRGCVSGDFSTAGPGASIRPRYSITDQQIAALSAYLNAPLPPTASATLFPASANELPGLFDRLRCAACHDRDGVRSARPDILIDEGEQGLAPELLPDLTHAGEKLHVPWMASLLRGDLPYKSRPWLKARMPAYPAYSKVLSQALAARHAALPAPNQLVTDATDGEAVLQTIAAGRELTLKDGLDCRQCHGLGAETPTADKDAKLALGVNFSHVSERVRKPFYDRWMIDPLRIDPLTKMPKFAFDGEHTKAHQILDGVAREQFEAIWRYLLTHQPAPGS